MEFNAIYKNGKSERFFIKLDKPKEFNFIQPYFIATDHENTRHGNILEMDCLFSCSVWQGRQRHGYGYSCSADVYGELISIIKELYDGKLSDKTLAELRAINTHDNILRLSTAALDELCELNNEAISAKFFK